MPGQRYSGMSKESGGNHDSSVGGSGRHSFALMKSIVQRQLQEQEARHREEVDELERTSKMALQSMAKGWADTRAQLAEQSQQSWEQSNQHHNRQTFTAADGVLQLSGTRSKRSTRSTRGGNGGRTGRVMHSTVRAAETPLPELEHMALEVGRQSAPSSPNNFAAVLGGDGASGPQVRGKHSSFSRW